MLYLALGIIGATVMPHNLYLHSAIVQTRAYGTTTAGKARGAEIRDARFDHRLDAGARDQRLDPDPRRRDVLQGRKDRRGRTCRRRNRLLHPLLGSAIAPTLFGIALLCCGLNSTVTATLAGQTVMEGFLQIRLAAWMRRLAHAIGCPASRRRRHAALRRSGNREAADPVASRLEPAAAVRDRAARPVHGEPEQDGRPRRAALADGHRRRHRGHHHRAQHQIDLGFHHRLNR